MEKRLNEPERNQVAMAGLAASIAEIRATLATLVNRDQNRSRSRLHTSHRTSGHIHAKKFDRPEGAEGNSEYFPSHQEDRSESSQSKLRTSDHISQSRKVSHLLHNSSSQSKSRTSSHISQSRTVSYPSQNSSPAISSRPRKARLRDESPSSSPYSSLSELMSSQVSQTAKDSPQSINKTEMEQTESVIKKMNKKDETGEQEQIIQWPENSCIGKKRSGTEAQEEMVDIVSGESAIIWENHPQIQDADKHSQFQHLGRYSMQLATLNIKDLAGSLPAEVSKWVQVRWAKSSGYGTMLNYLTVGSFLQPAEVLEAEFQPGTESMLGYSQLDLHDSFKAPGNYLMLEDISPRTALTFPDVFEFFTRLIQRMTFKNYLQALDEVADISKFSKNLYGDPFHSMARSSGMPENYLGQNNLGFRWIYGPLPSLKIDSRVCNIMEQMLLLFHDGGIPLEVVEVLNSKRGTQYDTSSYKLSFDMCVDEVLYKLFSEKFHSRDRMESEGHAMLSMVKSFSSRGLEVWKLLIPPSARYWEGRGTGRAEAPGGQRHREKAEFQTWFLSSHLEGKVDSQRGEY